VVHHRNGDLSPAQANTTRAARVGIPQANSAASPGQHGQSKRLTCGNDDHGQPESRCKVQQRGSGGCWRTLTGLADFALVESYLSTAAKSGISKIDALRDLFNGNAWMPPGLEPAG
jgi:hypothetical protein